MPSWGSFCTPLYPRRLSAEVVIIVIGCLAGAAGGTAADDSSQGGSPPSFGGIYPHLAFFNDEGECGTGAVVPWAGRLWVVTYAPHAPEGSSDKLYEITPDLRQIVRPESIGGTPANRMIHRESQQLFIGPYVIDATRQVRVIPHARMFGRPTGNARHLFDPAGKIYCASMEEALYEIDVNTLAVTTLFHDEARRDGTPKADLPGYHGKGLFSGQGRLVYANNGEHGDDARHDPTTPSGVLAEWPGSGGFRTVLRNQFTEVTGPGGIWGNENPDRDPIWSIGWDHRSLLLMLLDDGTWHRFRMPKASHAYDGAHGWNTEWPRIREIGAGDALLMTMHGMLWRFPRGFSAATTAGIRPRSTYLKVIGDFCRWQDRIVFGCDDTARSEFLNRRRAKGEIAGPRSQSNLWFVEPEQLDHLGPVVSRGAVWLDDPVAADTPSDPFLVEGFAHVGMHLSADGPTRIRLEIDRLGNGVWQLLEEIDVDGYRWHSLPERLHASWVRLRSARDLARGTAMLTCMGEDPRAVGTRPPIFAGWPKPGSQAVTGGVIRSRGGPLTTLHYAAVMPDGSRGLYELAADLRLRRVEDEPQRLWLEKHAAIPSREAVLTVDEASVIYTDDRGRVYRLPRDPAFDQPGPLGCGRLCREVATERDLFNCHGTFYELPADNAGGFAKVRPVATHGRLIHDFCSHRGLLVVSGLDLPAADGNRRVILSDDGRTGLWLGGIDELWQLGKPTGSGGPWKMTRVAAGVPSAAYLMTGYDRKQVQLFADTATDVSLDVDISGDGHWRTWKTVSLQPDTQTTVRFPDGFQAAWVRCISSRDATATAWFVYE